MRSILKDLAQVERYASYQVLHQVIATRTEVQVKIADNSRIIRTTLKKIGERKHFYMTSAPDLFVDRVEVTIKIIIQDKLFFLKTEIKKFQGAVYFDTYENMFELIRRKNPRFHVPKQWPQSAYIQLTDSLIIQPKKIQYLELTKSLTALATIQEISKSGMKLNIAAEIPRYEKNQTIIIRFKIFRRAEIQVHAKVIHIKKNAETGPTVGVQFMDDSILLKNKIQNICDDLAFFYTAQNGR